MKIHIIETLDPEKFCIKEMINGTYVILHPDSTTCYINKRGKVRLFSTIEAALNLLKTQGIEYAKVYT